MTSHPIKLRVWDVERSTFLENEVMWSMAAKMPEETMPGHPPWIPFLMVAIHSPETKYIVERFTGLKDAKGVDIYEGDIVSGKDVYDRGVVKWASYGDGEYVEELDTWMVEMPFRAPLSSLIRSPYHKGRNSRGPSVGPIEVVGNIHIYSNTLHST